MDLKHILTGTVSALVVVFLMVAVVGVGNDGRDGTDGRDGVGAIPGTDVYNQMVFHDTITFSVAPVVTAGGITVTDGDVVLTDGRLDLAIGALANNCASNAVTIDLASASSTMRVIQSDQVSGACAITFTNGTAGEFVVLDLTYGGDTAWTFVAGGNYLFDTWAEAECDGFEATAVNSDHLIVTGIMTDAASMMVLSCTYLDQ